MKQSSSSVQGFPTGFLARSGLLKTTGVLFRRRYVWLALAALILGALGWWVYESVEKAMQERMAAELTTIRDADEEALRVWMKQQQANARVLAQVDSVRSLAQELA